MLAPNEQKHLKGILNNAANPPVDVNLREISAANNNVDENALFSDRDGINGISNIEVQKTLGLQGNIINHNGKPLQIQNELAPMQQ